MFLVHGTLPKGCNASFIALIPKVSDPQNLNEYMPISLIGSIYKIVSRVLAWRLKEVLSTLIDERQTTFIEGRHLLHNTLIANEVIHEAKSGNRSCLIFKADFEKAYDSVSWDFLLYMLRRMGFCEKWISWIEGCLKSASISILINDSPKRSKTRGPTSCVIIQRCCGGTKWIDERGDEEKSVSRLLSG